MKPIPAIIESDIARVAAAVDEAINRVREAEDLATQADRRAQNAHESVRARRLELGRALVAARRHFPVSGKNAKAWTDFLAVRRMTLEQAQDAMAYAGFVDERLTGASENAPGELPTMRDAGLDPRPRDAELDPQAVIERDVMALLQRMTPDARKRIGKVLRANVAGGSGEVERGTWCTPKQVAEDVGPWDLDPFSSPRSHIVAAHVCMLEDGGDGFGDAEPGSYRRGTGNPDRLHGRYLAGPTSRVWIQPPYDIVERAIAHYGHTRFCALLRFAPDTAWFAKLIAITSVLAIPIGWRCDFEPPEGIVQSSNPYPHALYYADERDVTDAVRARYLVARVDHTSAPPTLHIVR